MIPELVRKIVGWILLFPFIVREIKLPNKVRWRHALARWIGCEWLHIQASTPLGITCSQWVARENSLNLMRVTDTD